MFFGEVALFVCLSVFSIIPETHECICRKFYVGSPYQRKK